MSSREHLTPKQTTDRNGKQTTVYVNEAKGTTTGGATPTTGAPVPAAVSRAASVEAVDHAEGQLREQGYWHDNRLWSSADFRAAAAERLDLDPETVDIAAERAETEAREHAAAKAKVHAELIASTIAATPERPRRGDLVVVDKRNPRVIKLDSVRAGYASGNTADGYPRERIEDWRVQDILREVP